MRRAILPFILFLLSSSAFAQSSFRFSYLFYAKRDVADEKYHTSDMKLDFDGRTTFFYNENGFKRDSLDVIVFDGSGNIIDEEAYGKRTRIQAVGSSMISWVDFEQRTFTVCYAEPATFIGSMPMELPQWEFTGEEETITGYSCKIAKGRYLGREWTVWYTEDIPVNVGPWLLWGTPGLIVKATDSEHIFYFELFAVERIAASRLKDELSYRETINSRSHRKLFDMDMKGMETMHTRYNRDSDYMERIHGITGGYIEDRNGNRKEISRTNPYIPLISDDFWKK